MSSGWKIEFTGIPDYDHTMTQDDIDTLNNRPNADTDFISGSTTASVGDVVTFAEDIGYSTDACEYGYWPPGPVCPEAYDGSWIFSLAPAPETNTGTFLLFYFLLFKMCFRWLLHWKHSRLPCQWCPILELDGWQLVQQ